MKSIISTKFFLVYNVIFFLSLTYSKVTFAQQSAENDLLKNPPERGFISTKPADTWEQAIISGNGTIGALVMSHPLDETIIFSHERLFMPWDKITPLVNIKPHLKEIRQLIDEGKYREAAQIPIQLANTKYGYKIISTGDGMLWPDPISVAFDLKIKMKSKGKVKRYARSVDWQTGVASVQWADNRGLFKRELFVSRADNVAVLSIKGPNKGLVNCQIQLATRPHGDESIVGTDEPVFEGGIEDYVITADRPWITYRSSFKRDYFGSIEGYEGLVRVVTQGGSSKVEKDYIQVKGADEVLVFIHVDVLYDYENSKLDMQQKRLQNLESDFSVLLNRHEQIHGEVFNRMRLELGGNKEDHKLPAEKLIEKSSLGNLNKALLEKQFDACRYAILSSSGELPPSLQGIWNGSWAPRWRGDFTIDGNIQSAVASMLMANMPESMESYIDYTESFISHYRENAKQIYGYRGILMPSRVSGHGYLTHFDEEFVWLYWIASAPWAAHFFYDYYLFTEDMNFLRERAVPFMKEIALFYEDFLIEGEEGKYVFNPSYSPENTPSNSNSQICYNATMDIGIAKELLTNLIVSCEELDIEQEGVKKWKTMLTKMPDYIINEDGAVKEWTTPKLEENYPHRHASHFIHLADWLPPDINNSPKLRKAFRMAIEMKMRHRWRKTGGGMAFGLVQLGQAATSLEDAKLSYEIVDMLANWYWETNMVSTHNPKSIFNVDISGGMPAVIIKMLVMSERGKIKLLPSLPKEWPSGQIEGVLCRGQVEIKKLAWEEKEVEVSLVSQKPENLILELEGIKKAEVREGNASIIDVDVKGGVCLVGIPPGELVKIHFFR